ncbi:glycosyltransferase [Halosquirtibacter laminarini]|uniref:Glycosyltransferase n=1 Tax=Halosquirtibacter laminarini TaxID=3374600 RepID=A0AC61NL79_9BACT|nr:glycosyltransferase [Prolixibacteraceae bacterium]
MILISIVIPVYNVELYLENCIKSCLSGLKDHDPSSFEIILVNDESTDGSLSICEFYVRNYEFIRLINQTNGGLSNARNSGLKASKGQYIWFVDSDDLIIPSIISHIYNSLNGSYDLLWIDYITSNECYIEQNKSNFEVTGEKLYIDYLNDKNFAWRFIYNRQFLLKSNLYFYEGIYYEDFEFTPRVLAIANKCLVITKIGYIYNIRGNSISNSCSRKHIEDLLFIQERLLSNNKFSEKMKCKLLLSVKRRIRIIFNMLIDNGYNIKDFDLSFYSDYNILKIEISWLYYFYKFVRRTYILFK